MYGPCRDCGAPGRYEMCHGRRKRPTWYWCQACYATDRARYDAENARINADRRAEGAVYWQDRGIKVGQTVQTQTMGLFGPRTWTGIAKAGTRGPYVHMKGRNIQLDPAAWKPGK